MSKVRIIEAAFAGWKIKVDKTSAQQLPKLEQAKERAIILAKSMNETEVEIYDQYEELIEVIKVEG